MSTEADALAAIAALLADVRTANGYATDLGSDVRRSFIFGELADDADWQTLIYRQRELRHGQCRRRGIAGNQRVYDLALVIPHRRTPQARWHRARQTLRQTSRPTLARGAGPVRRLKLAGVEVGAIRYLPETRLIPEALASGALGSEPACASTRNRRSRTNQTATATPGKARHARAFFISTLENNMAHTR